MITVIVAVARNGVIGKDSAIPWRLSADLKRFKQLTTGKAVVMGRKTWDSLPKKPLPQRINIVITRKPDWRAEGAVTASSWEDALAKAGKNEVMVIGGAEIYRQALSDADRIELTEIDRDFEGDTHFRFDRSKWREIAREEHVTDDGLPFRYIVLLRR